MSARHISFLETGRSRPSVDMIRRLGDALDLPLIERNQMLHSAGFAPQHLERDWSDDDMAPVRAALDRLLDRHLPYPGLAVDRLWRVQKMNATARAMFSFVGLGEGGSLLELMQSDQLRALVENWSEVAAHAARRLRTESAALGGEPVLLETAATLVQSTEIVPVSTSPVVPLRLNLGGQCLSMFSTLAQFGTPEDIALDDLKIELYFPVDEQTEQGFRQMMPASG